MQPLISIITPVYNGAAYLDELILSVLAQDYSNYEHIIIDDGSNDDGATIAILKKYPHLRWWSRANKGQYATMNEGLTAAQGEIVTVICADDKYADASVLSSVIDCWQQHSDCGVLYGNTLRMNEHSELLPLNPTLPKPPYSARFLCYWLPIAHCSLFVKKQRLLEHELFFDLSLRYVADWDWIIRLAQVTNFAYLNQSLSVYRMHSQQTSHVEARQIFNVENKKIRQRYHVNTLIYLFILNKQRVLKALWLLRTQGLNALYLAIKQWLNR